MRRVIGLILAGGKARRMGGADKALVPCCGRPLLSWVIERAAPQVDEILVSANGDPARFAAFGFPVLADRIGGHLGPVAGILSGLAWMKAYRPEAQWLATFACDTPFFPHDLVTRLAAKAEDTRSLVGVAASGGRQHGVFAVWSARIVETTESVLVKDRLRRVDDFIGRLPSAVVDIPIGSFDPFFNVNTPADLAMAEALAPEVT